MAGQRQGRQAPAWTSKTDRLDSVWLCKVAERHMVRPSFVLPPEIRQLRDLTLYRASLVAARTAEKQRTEKLEAEGFELPDVVAPHAGGADSGVVPDDTLLGFAGPKAEAEQIKARLATFLRDDLKLEMSRDQDAHHLRAHPGCEIPRLRDHRAAQRPQGH